MSNLDPDTLVSQFAIALKSADSRRPQASGRKGRVYKPGIGPHAEEAAVGLVLQELRQLWPEQYHMALPRVPYPGGRQWCDLGIGPGPEWAVEVKMARFFGDNGKPDDTAIKDLLSPFEEDRSALADCMKLAGSAFPGKMALLIYGFEGERGGRPLCAAIRAFEVLAQDWLSRIGAALGLRSAASFANLVHPVHKEGAVFGWEILGVAR